MVSEELVDAVGHATQHTHDSGLCPQFDTIHFAGLERRRSQYRDVVSSIALSTWDVIASVEGGSRGSSGLGPVVIVVGLTIGGALVLTWLFNRLPGSNENTGASPFGRWRRSNSFDRPPEKPKDQPPRGPFDS